VFVLPSSMRLFYGASRISSVITLSIYSLEVLLQTVNSSSIFLLNMGVFNYDNICNFSMTSAFSKLLPKTDNILYLPLQEGRLWQKTKLSRLYGKAGNEM
jgi:hypothetical protein